jgi:hypothetical protein
MSCQREVEKVKKLGLVVALLAVLVVAAAPAIAQVAQGFGESRVTSGPASPSTAVSNAGDNVNLCPSVQQTANTGQVANEQGVVQYFSTADDIEFAGSELTVTPSETATCTETIEQAAAAG